MGESFLSGKALFVGQPKRVDYLLRYRRDFTLAVVEAKSEYNTAADGLQQAKQYAEMLGLKFAYATNGPEIVEFDYFTGKERKIDSYPSPEELWQRFREGEALNDDKQVEQLSNTDQLHAEARRTLLSGDRNQSRG